MKKKGRNSRHDEGLKELGRYFYSLSQLVCGGTVLTVLLDYTKEKALTLVLGMLAVVAFAIVGWMLIKRGNN